MIKEMVIMDKKQAMDLLTQVCANFRGTIQEHQALQQALKIVSEEETTVNIEKSTLRNSGIDVNKKGGKKNG